MAVPADEDKYADWTGPRSGWPPRRPILEMGVVVDSVAQARPRSGYAIQEPDSTPSGRPLQGVIVSESDDGSIIHQIYADRPISATETLPELYQGGGIQLTQQPTSGRTADAVAEAVGAVNVTIVGISRYDGALIHGTPLETEIRPWHLYWSDGAADYSVVGGRSDTDVVEFARSIYCNV
jgi:hypothetical protein